MRIIVCDGHLLFAEALSALLESRGHHVAAPIGAPDDADRVTPADSPDIWVTELSFPGYGPGDVVRRLRSSAPDAAIVVLTAVTDPAFAAAAAEAGADAVASKSLGLDELEGLLETGADRAGRRLRARPGEGMSPAAGARVTQPDRTALTGRELEVMARLAQGQGTAELAGVLGVAVSTVRTHLQHLYRKVGVHSRLELVAYAVRHGLVRCGDRATDGTGTRSAPTGLVPA